MKILVCLLVLCCVVIGNKVLLEDKLFDEEKFGKFMIDYGRKYHSKDEYDYRFSVFLNNMNISEYLNQRDPFAKYGITKFSDLTQEEFKENYLIKNFYLSKNQKRALPCPQRFLSYRFLSITRCL